MALKKLDIHTWDTSDWAVTNNGGCFNSIYTLKECLTPTSFNLTSSSSNNNVPNSWNLETFNGFTFYQNCSYSSSYKLTITSLVNIISHLPTLSSTKTITLGTVNKLKLTAEQIAVATQKGWTVA